MTISVISTAFVLGVLGVVICSVAGWRRLGAMRRVRRHAVVRDIVAARDAAACGDAPTGRQIIAVIGIDHYAHWPRLHNAVGDARGALQLFQRRGFALAPRRDQAENAAVHSKVPFCRKAASRSRPASIAATGQYEGPPGFDRGMQAVRHCGDHPESWVRVSANLDTRAGIVAVDLQLETDSVAKGPKGRATVDVHGARGELLATIESTEVGIGGKPPGKARTQLYTASAALRASFARRAAALAIRVGCTGSIQQPLGVGGASSTGFQLTVK